MAAKQMKSYVASGSGQGRMTATTPIADIKIDAHEGENRADNGPGGLSREASQSGHATRRPSRCTISRS